MSINGLESSRAIMAVLARQDVSGREEIIRTSGDMVEVLTYYRLSAGGHSFHKESFTMQQLEETPGDLLDAVRHRAAWHAWSELEKRTAYRPRFQELSMVRLEGDPLDRLIAFVDEEVGSGWYSLIGTAENDQPFTFVRHRTMLTDVDEMGLYSKAFDHDAERLFRNRHGI